MTGRTATGAIETVEIVSPASPVANYAFDVTPAKYVTGLITEVGVIAPTREAIGRAFPARAKAAA
jgi:methylthioribose-1-phosphate isomerase